MTESYQTIKKKPVYRKDSSMMKKFKNNLRMKMIHNKLSSKIIGLYNQKNPHSDTYTISSRN